MNEMIFLFHALILVGATLGALRFGREGLIALITLCILLANLFVLKQIVLFRLQVTCSDLYAVGAMIALNLFQEFYGPKAASRAIWISSGAALLFTAMSVAHLLYLPGPDDWTHPSFTTLLAPMPRLAISSLAILILVQRLDLWLFGQLKKGLPNSSMALRSGISTALSQATDTALFTLIALAGVASSLLSIMLFSYLIKLITLALLTPITLLAKRWAPSP